MLLSGSYWAFFLFPQFPIHSVSLETLAVSPETLGGIWYFKVLNGAAQ